MKWDERIGRRIKLKDLHLLEAIAERGSMARAAEDLSLSQAAISKAVSELEHTLGASLLTRNARGAELTESGSILLRHGRVVFDELRQGLLEIQNRADPAVGEVRIGTLEHLTPFVSSVIGDLTRRFPRVTVHVVVADATSLIRGLRDRALDLVIARQATAAEAFDLAGQVLFRDRLAIAAASTHPLTRKRTIALADLMNERWVLSPPDAYLGRLVTQMFRAHELEPPAATVTTVSVQMRVSLLESGRFLGVYSTAMLHSPANKDKLRALNVDIKEVAGPMAAITQKKRQFTGPMKLFAAELAAAAKRIASVEERRSN
jgi:molybdate transport repressor ModE-like protein